MAKKLAADTRHIVSFQLNEAEKKEAIKKAGSRKRINKHAKLVYTTSLKENI